MVWKCILTPFQSYIDLYIGIIGLIPVQSKIVLFPSLSFPEYFCHVRSGAHFPR